MKIKIGCVTGDSHYFLIRESKRVQLGLPIRVLRPVLTRTRHLTTALATRTYWKTLREADERVWLFRPHSRHVKVPSVRRYLRLDPKRGGCNRKAYKIKNREHWYRPEVPNKVDGFISGTSQRGPWISLNQYRKLSVTNTLYCVTFTMDMSRDQRAAWAMALLSSRFRQQYVKKVRAYPDGLAKIEPGDFAALRISRPPKDCKGAHKKYQEAVSLLLGEGRSAAEKVVEDWFRSREA